MTKARPAPPQQPATVPGLRGRVALTRLALLWEMAWRGLWRPASALAFFLGLSLFDIWRMVPVFLHWLALMALALFCAVTIYQQRRYIRLPSRTDILARIERDNGLRHHPLRALEDRPELGAGTPEAQTLWHAHLTRIRQTLPRLKQVLPRPRAIRLDRHGLRQMSGIVLIAGLLTAGPHWWIRIEAGFMPARLGPTVPHTRIEAWITPPVYTGAAPVMLAGDASAAARAANPDQPQADAPITVPAGSELSLRLFGGRDAELLAVPDAGRRQRLPMTKIDNVNSQATVRLEQSQKVQLRLSGVSNREWRITVIPDQPPVIGLLEDVTITRQYGLRIKYGATDDYGVTATAAEIAPAADKKSLPQAPVRVEFPPPQKAGKNGQTAYVDLTAHPLAGSSVRLRLIATDATGQTGYTEPVGLVLPQRPFKQPLARAIIEQRRILAAKPSQDAHTIQALDALSLYPDKFIQNLQVYLTARVARHAIQHIRDNGEARNRVIELLWRLALQLEDGDLSIASNELRQLQKALMQALRDGASDKEIANLTQALREALERYVQAMNEQALDDEIPMQGGQQGNSEVVNKSDLDAMLDQIEKLSKSGARAAAQEMLSRLEDVLENMRAGQGGQQPSPARKLYGDALQDLSSMMRQQQQLQDETYQQQQNGGEGKGGLARNQDKLRGELGDLMGKLGRGPKEGTPNALGRAERAMRDAVTALRKGESRDALAQQGQAMDQLRAGAGALAKMLRDEDARSQAENGDGGEKGQKREKTDPLGRPSARESTGATAIPEQFDIERALQIRRELEQRASQRRRPTEELNYIDRLLKLF